MLYEVITDPLQRRVRGRWLCRAHPLPFQHARVPRGPRGGGHARLLRHLPDRPAGPSGLAKTRFHKEGIAHEQDNFRLPPAPAGPLV